MSPQILVDRYLEKRLREDARVAAFILRAWPEFSERLGHRKVDAWLSQMACGEVSPETVLALTETVPVNGSRTLGSMQGWQKDRLAGHLDLIARGKV